MNISKISDYKKAIWAYQKNRNSEHCTSGFIVRDLCVSEDTYFIDVDCAGRWANKFYQYPPNLINNNISFLQLHSQVSRRQYFRYTQIENTLIER